MMENKKLMLSILLCLMLRTIYCQIYSVTSFNGRASLPPADVNPSSDSGHSVVIYKLPSSNGVTGADPTFINAGVEIKQGQYLIPSIGYSSGGNIHYSAGLWMYYIEGPIGFFLKNNFKYNYRDYECFGLEGYVPNGATTPSVRIISRNGYLAEVGQVNLGWNWIGFGKRVDTSDPGSCTECWCNTGSCYQQSCTDGSCYYHNDGSWHECNSVCQNYSNSATCRKYRCNSGVLPDTEYRDKLFRYVCTSSSCSLNDNIAAPLQVGYLSGNQCQLEGYIGCFNCTEPTHYIIHSFAFRTSHSFDPTSLLSTLVSNAFLNCGTLVKVGKNCDDGNIFDGDGCSSTCNIEDRYECEPTPDGKKDICHMCGNDVVEWKEQCDYGEGNQDGCSTNCQIEFGYVCHTPEYPNSCFDLCGDGYVFGDVDENYCDDHNNKTGDGCDPECHRESGYTCINGSPEHKSDCFVLCGDGEVGPGEECDDGNTQSGDGCSSECDVEDGYSCSSGNEWMSSVCIEICGDGKSMNGFCEFNYCYVGFPCDDGNTDSGDGCDQNCVIEEGFQCTGGAHKKKDVCNEICHDNRVFDSNECEDGNYIEGDGCTNLCELEECFECSGGSKETVDTCRKLKIQANMSEIIPSQEYAISFNHEMYVTELGLNDLDVSIVADTFAKLSWTAQYIDNYTLKITINIQSVLDGSEKLKVRMTNHKTVRGYNGGCPRPNNFTIDLISSLESSAESAKSMGDFTQYIVIGCILCMFGLLMICGGSVEILWSLINTLQLITFLPLMIPYYPDHVKIMFQLLNFVNMDVGFISAMFTGLIGIDGLDTKPLSTRFTKNGIESPLFLLNCSSLIVSLFMTLSFLLLLGATYYTVCCKNVKTRISKILSMYYWNNFLRFFTEGYLEIMFGAILNIISMSRNSRIELVSLGVSVGIFIPGFVFPFLTATLLYDKRKDISGDNDPYVQRFGTMYSDCKLDKKWFYFQYYPIFLIRRLIFISFLIVLIQFPEIQINAFIIASMLVSFYQILCKPFKTTIVNWLCMFNESTLFMISLIQSIFIIDLSNALVVNITGWIMIGLVGGMIALNIFTIAPYTIYMKIKSRPKHAIVPEDPQTSVFSFRESTAPMSTTRREIPSIRDIIPRRRF